MGTEIQDTPPLRMRQLRWYPPLLGVALAVALIATGIFLFGSTPPTFSSPIFYVAIGGIIGFCLLLISFVWNLVKHFVWTVDPRVWITVLFILIVITTLGIAAVIFLLYLIFAYYPAELQQEIKQDAEMSRGREPVTLENSQLSYVRMTEIIRQHWVPVAIWVMLIALLSWAVFHQRMGT